jgi:hypothetical protein
METAGPGDRGARGDPLPFRLGEAGVGDLIQHLKAAGIDALDQPADKQLILFDAHGLLASARRGTSPGQPMAPAQAAPGFPGPLTAAA